MRKKTLIALVPVIHITYLELLQKYPDNLLILSDEVLRDWDQYPLLRRDVRTIQQEKILSFINSAQIARRATLATKETLKEVLENDDEIIMPDEDVSHWIAQKYFPQKEVTYEKVFLRWDKSFATKECETSPNRTVSQDKGDRELIQYSENEAKKSANWWRQIGALVVDEKKKVILSAYNRHMPTQQNIAVYGDLRSCFDAGEHHELSNSIHAEASLIGQAANKGIALENTRLYVTTFPCPTCAKLVAESGIKKVYYKEGYSLSDAQNILAAHGIELIKVN